MARAAEAAQKQASKLNEMVQAAAKEGQKMAQPYEKMVNEAVQDVRKQAEVVNDQFQGTQSDSSATITFNIPVAIELRAPVC